MFRKLLYTTFIVVVTVPTCAQSVTDIVSLNEFIAKNSDAMATDPPTLQYVAKRCSALYVALAKALDGETAPDRVKLMKELLDKSTNSLGTAVNIELGNPTKNTDANVKDIPKQAQMLANIYVDKMRDARLRLGSFWEDKIVSGDYKICEVIMKR
ncbi:MAG: hypothetical protein WCC90_20510 [Methylocella sp.]